MLLEALGRRGSVIAPLVASAEHLGFLCAVAAEQRVFTTEEEGLFRAVADQAAVALKKSELIERLTAENLVKDVFDALEAGATDVAAAKASEAGLDLARPHAFLHAEPVTAAFEERLRELLPTALVDVRPEGARVLVTLPADDQERRAAEIHASCDELARDGEVVIGLSRISYGVKESARALGEATDASRIGRALRGPGAALRHDQLGAHRYLVHLDLEKAPHDDYWRAVEALIEYDERRRTRLVETLEQSLRDRRSIAASARALFIHPNTVRQRLDRIETLSGLAIAAADLLSLELAIKLVRLHRAPR